MHFFPRERSTLVTDATVWITGLSITQSFPSYCYWVRPQQSTKMSWHWHFTTLFAVYAVKFPLARPALNLSDCSKCIHYSESHRVFIVRQLDTQQIIMLYRALLVLQTYWMESTYPPTLTTPRSWWTLHTQTLASLHFTSASLYLFSQECDGCELWKVATDHWT